MFIIDYKDKTPIFQQIENQVIYYMSIGVLKKNDKLPSIRNLALELKVNFNTVAKAYTSLEMKQIIYAVHKKGYFVGDVAVKQEIIDQHSTDLKDCVHKLKQLDLTKDQIIQLIESVYKEENKC